MLKNLLNEIKRAAAPVPEMMSPGERHRSVEGSNTAELASRLLIAPTALMQLTREEAMIVVSHM